MRNCLLLLFLCTPFISFSADNDSVGTKVIDEKQYVLHKVENGEYWYSIARKYKVGYKELRLANPEILGTLVIDQVILIPFPLKSRSDSTLIADGFVRKDVVGRREAHHLDSSASQAGDTLLSSSAMQKKISSRTLEERGIASWIDDQDINPTRYFALHRTAPSGTIIRITNAMNGKYVYVKVVGVLPDTGDNTNISIRISRLAGKKLGMEDEKFQAELRYSIDE